MTPPEKCQNCSYATRYRRQKDGETPLYVPCCEAWMCAGCRKLKKCRPPVDPPAEARARLDLQLAVPPNDGFYSRVPDTVYHADRTSLSSSGARLIQAVPALFKAHQDEPPNPKPVYDFGHAAHKMVLGEGSQLVKVDADNWRTGEAQKKRNQAWLEGKVPLLKKDIDLAQIMAGKVHAHPIAGRLLFNGSAEMSGYWHDDETSVRLRFRPDWLTDPGESGGRIICVDYKTAKSADPTKFGRAVHDYGYHCQAAWYLDGLREVEISDDAGFLFVLQEKTPPFLVSVVQIDPADVQRGRALNRRAINTYAECRQHNVWPGYGDGISMVSLPAWAASQTDASLDADHNERKP